MKKWPKCQWSALLLHCLLSSSLHPWPHGEFPTIGWQRKGRLQPGLQMVLHDLTRKWITAALQHLSGTSLKNNGEGKTSWWAELGAVHLVVHFVWKEKWPDVRWHTVSWMVVNGLAGWSRTWKDHDWKIGDKENLGRGYVDRLLWTGKKIWRYLFSVWMLTKGWTQQRRILII